MPSSSQVVLSRVLTSASNAIHKHSGSNLLLLSNHPIIPLALSRQSSNAQYFWQTRIYTQSRNFHQGARQKDNGARLYARRCLELAAASAAAARAMTPYTSMEEAGRVGKPTRWSEIDRTLENEAFAKGAGLGKTKLSRVLAAGRRIASLAILVSPLLVLTPLAMLAGPNSTIDKKRWDYALWSVEKAGPTFIKLTQWASTRSDLFNEDFISHFSKLQDSTRGHGWDSTHTMLQSNLGENYQSEYLEIDPTIDPIGSGCIAQVYRGTLKQPTGFLPAGTEVAVKVQHPRIRRKVFEDFYIMNKVASFLERIPYLNLDYLSIQDSVDQFRSIMLPQMDLRCEARNLTRFLQDFANDDEVTFPQPIHELTSNDILVETFMHGEPILNYLHEGRTMEDRKLITTIGLRMVMEMIFLYDFVHGDLHPGNILVDKKPDGTIRLNILDCGLVVEMGETEHRNLVRILGAFIKRDGMSAGSLMVDTAKRCQASALDVALFCEGIQKICTDDLDNNFLEKVGDYLADICYLACKHKVKLEASFINAALACEIMEGIATQLYPSLQCQTIALPMVLKAEFMHGIKHMKVPKISIG